MLFRSGDFRPLPVDLDPLFSNILVHQRLRQIREPLAQEFVQPLTGIILRYDQTFQQAAP